MVLTRRELGMAASSSAAERLGRIRYRRQCNHAGSMKKTEVSTALMTSDRLVESDSRTGGGVDG